MDIQLKVSVFQVKQLQTSLIRNQILAQTCTLPIPIYENIKAFENKCVFTIMFLWNRSVSHIWRDYVDYRRHRLDWSMSKIDAERCSVT